jgi:hypothetical protein
MTDFKALLRALSEAGAELEAIREERRPPSGR